MKKFIAAIMMASACLAVAACSPIPDDQQPPSSFPSPIPSPTATPRAVRSNPPIAPGSPPETLFLDDPAIYEPPESAGAYSLGLELTVESRSGQAVLHIDGAVSDKIPAILLQYSASGSAVLGDEETIQAGNMGGETYVFSSQTGCLQGGPAPEDIPYAFYLEPFNFLTGEAGFQTADELVGGLTVYRFSLGSENFTAGPRLNLADFDTGAITIAQDGGYLVALQFSGRGSAGLISGSDSAGSLAYRLVRDSFGEPVDISLPAGCTDSAAAGAPYPVPDDAASLVIAPGLVSFQIPSTVEEIEKFYQKNLDPLGWSPFDAVFTETEATILYENEDGLQLTVVITPDPAGGPTAVVLYEGELD